MKVEAKFWEKMSGKKVRCFLCARRCEIADGKTGVCRARINEDGKMFSLVYGSIVSMAVDPIEKKPLYHFWPGSDVFSIAAPGCNFFCKHCQNWEISQASIFDIPCEEIPPERLVDMTEESGSSGIAHTYTEPTLWSEYAIDVGKIAHKRNLYNVYVTNGFMTIEALEEIGKYIDAANVDVKAFSEDFYRRICGVTSIQPVLESCEWMVEHGVHLEITYLIIPGENDGREEIEKFSRWVVEKLGENVPVHFSRFYPHFKMTDKPPTPVETLEMAVEIARKAGVKFVYIGNVPGHEFDNTYCPSCGGLLIERRGFYITEYRVRNGKCPDCGEKIPIVGRYLKR
ncbi:MAG: AmmeMemoRadiSam system radical SAM enzyme [Candidatus Hadarchaeales archaeon]